MLAGQHIDSTSAPIRRFFPASFSRPHDLEHRVFPRKFPSKQSISESA